MAANVTERKLAAIMIADVVGFSRLMERDESLTFARLRRLREEVNFPKIQEHGGRVIKTTGDGFLAEFSSATAAVRCGIDIQRSVIELESGQTDDDRIRFRIGINVGDIIIDGDDIAGDGVNLAARLEPLSPPNGLCISSSVREQIRDELGVTFQDMGEQMLKNIQRPVRAFSVRLAEMAGVLDVFNVAKPVRGFAGRPAIAVLPFDNMSNDSDQEYFADGIAEDILTRLAMWRWMPVIGRNSSFAYRGKSLDLKKIGTELGARYILEGSVRKLGNRVRVTGQLIDTETGHHVWAQRYDRVLEDIFALQDEITEAIVTALEPAVGQAERKRVMQKSTQSFDAWELYQRGAWHYSQFTRESLKEAYKFCLESSQVDTQFSTPLAGAAFTRMVEALFAWSDPAEAIGDVYRLALEATNRDPIDPFALAALGCAYALNGYHDAAIQTCTKSVELNPSYAIGHNLLGYAMLLNGQLAQSVESIETAVRLSPNDQMMLPTAFPLLAVAYYLGGDYGRSREIAALATQKFPHFPGGFRVLAMALGQLGHIEEGRMHLETFLALVPSFSSEMARRTFPLRHDRDFEHYIEGFQKLGWNG